MDNVSFPSRLFIIYDLTTKKTGVSQLRNIEHKCYQLLHLLSFQRGAIVDHVQEERLTLPAHLHISHYPPFCSKTLGIFLASRVTVRYVLTQR